MAIYNKMQTLAKIAAISCDPTVPIYLIVQRICLQVSSQMFGRNPGHVVFHLLKASTLSATCSMDIPSALFYPFFVYFHASCHPQERFYQGGGQLDYFPRLWCPHNHYALWAQFFFAPLSQALRLVFHMGEPFPDTHEPWMFEVSSLAILFVYTFGLMTWTYGVGAATGLFVPSLTVGATSGRLIGR